MKTNLFTIALAAAATMIPAFAAQTPATSPSADKPKPAATATKKHKKAVKKHAVKPAAGSTSTAKPAGTSK